MNYDILIIIILFAWSIARILQKKLIKGPTGPEFAKWTIIIGSILVLPLIPFVKLSPLNVMLGIFFVSLLWMIEQFSKFIALKKEEVSRLSAFAHFKFFFAMALAIIFLKEAATLSIILGGVLMVLGGMSIGLEKNFYKKVKVSNVALLLFIFSMLISGVGYFWRKFLLQVTDPFSILFFSTIFAGILVFPTIKRKPPVSSMKLFVFVQFLMVYGFLLFLWILSKQDLILTVPILAAQPLIILLLGKKFLKESQETFLTRTIGTVLIIVGYVILKGFIL